MLFHFLRYTNPVWYYNLLTTEGRFCFADYNKLFNEQKLLIDYDASYTHEKSRLADAAYQAWQRGVIHLPSQDLPKPTSRLPIQDEYHFIKKYYSPAWLVFILFVRLLSLKNPIAEISGFLSAFKIRRFQFLIDKSDSAQLLGSNSLLASDTPFVTVIIPTLNRYKYLRDVLSDLENQIYKNFEVIIVDQSDPYEPGFYERWNIDIQLVRQEAKALWQARNSAIKMAKGSLLLLFDDDSRVNSDWIIQHLNCINYFKADISSGVSLSAVGSKIPENYSYFRWGDQIDTGNVLLKRGIFQKIGLFDLQFERQRMGDGEFGLRAYLAGFKNISNPLAKRIHLKVSEGGLRQMGSWDAFRPRKLSNPRPVPSVLYLYRRYFGNKLTFLALITKVPLSIVPYKWKGKVGVVFLGALMSPILAPVILFQLAMSWKQSSAKIDKGPMIEKLV